MTTFYWDTNLFIYRFDAASPHHADVSRLSRRMIEQNVQMLTSTLTLGELQVGPKKSGDEQMAARFKTVISQAATIVSFDEKAADAYAVVRQKTPIKGPDAIQLACAASYGVELFVTNDDRLQKYKVPGIHFVVSIQTALGLLG